MLNRFRWEISVGILLIVMTSLLGWAHGLIFKDMRTLLFYLGEDVTFLPIQILLVSLVVEGLLNLREKQQMLSKLYMVIEVFFSEVGVTLLGKLSVFDGQVNELQRYCAGINQWSERQFRDNRERIKSFPVTVDCRNGNLEELRLFLLSKRNFLLRLLENPNLLEHETFTDLLWAVFHLSEELSHRKSCDELCEADQGHFANDIKRAYLLLIHSWLGYMGHLKANYPYLYSLASRLNPFDPEASVEIKE